MTTTAAFTNVQIETRCAHAAHRLNFPTLSTQHEPCTTCDGCAQTGELAPTVGMGATHVMWTDRHAYTVVAVSPTGKTVTVQRDKATRIDANGMSESQDYTYERDPKGTVFHLRKTKKGWASKGDRFSLGNRREYHDFSF